MAKARNKQQDSGIIGTRSKTRGLNVFGSRFHLTRQEKMRRTCQHSSSHFTSRVAALAVIVKLFAAVDTFKFSLEAYLCT